MELKEAENKKTYEKAKKAIIWLVFAILLSLISLLWLYHSSYFEINSETVKITDENPLFSDLFKLLAFIGVAGFIGLVSLYMYHRQASAAEKQTPFIERQASAAEKQASIMDKQASANEKNNLENKSAKFFKNYSRAIDQLGSEKIEIRLGAISSLEMIADKSDEYFRPILKILTAYIREKSHTKEGIITKNPEKQEKDKSLPTDFQAILELICKREHSFNEKLDLRKSNLRKAQLFKAHLEGADLSEADIWGADLVEAHLENAQLSRAYLEDSILVRAHLNNADLLEACLVGAYIQGADFQDACLIKAQIEDAHLENTIFVRAFLEETNFNRAHLEGANFVYAHLKGAYLYDTYLIGTHFEIANLEGAYLEGANLEGAHLEGADLRGAHLKEAQNLKPEQLCNVKTLFHAELDEGLEAELRAKGFGHLLDDEP